MSTEKFFDIIRDGQMHNLNELAEQLEVPVEKLAELSRSLSNLGMVEYDEDTQKIGIKLEWRKLLPSEKSEA